MLKIVLNFLVFFLVLTSSSFADETDVRLQVKLEKEYGRDLVHVPFFLRFAFNKEFNKDWKMSDYDERKAFLTEYETNLEAEQVKEKAEAQFKAALAKEQRAEKREVLRRQRDKLKAEAQARKADQEAQEEHKKALDQAAKEQQLELQEMLRESVQKQS